MIGAIAARLPPSAQQGQYNTDPFAIAARIKSCFVVSGQKNGGPDQPEIPTPAGAQSAIYKRFIDVVVRAGLGIRLDSEPPSSIDGRGWSSSRYRTSKDGVR
jgi:hypothetical protein